MIRRKNSVFLLQLLQVIATFDHNIGVWEENANFFAENCDHNIDPFLSIKLPIFRKNSHFNIRLSESMVVVGDSILHTD
jgi:hypothetical protein